MESHNSDDGGRKVVSSRPARNTVKSKQKNHRWKSIQIIIGMPKVFPKLKIQNTECFIIQNFSKYRHDPIP